MKLFTTFFLIAFWPLLSKADSRMTAEMIVSNNLVGEMYVQIDSIDQELPKSWDDFESIGMMKNQSLKHQLFRAKIINTFALVPGAPVIASQPGISREYYGHRLFLVSRVETFTKSQGGGRYAILIKPEELDSKPVRIFSHFIPEEIAELILKQVSSFDPERQPRAFQDLSVFEKEQSRIRDNLTVASSESPVYDPLGRNLSSGSSDVDKGAFDFKATSIWVLVALAAAFILILILCRKIRMSKSDF
jgi:hypothetical protein